MIKHSVGVRILSTNHLRAYFSVVFVCVIMNTVIVGLGLRRLAGLPLCLRAGAVLSHALAVPWDGIGQKGGCFWQTAEQEPGAFPVIKYVLCG